MDPALVRSEQQQNPYRGVHVEGERQGEGHAHRHRHAGDGADDDPAEQGEDRLRREHDVEGGLKMVPYHDRLPEPSLEHPERDEHVGDEAEEEEEREGAGSRRERALRPGALAAEDHEQARREHRSEHHAEPIEPGVVRDQQRQRPESAHRSEARCLGVRIIPVVPP